MRKYIYLYLALLIYSLPLSAQDSPDDDLIIPERPGFTNPPQTVEKGKIQIESGFYYESDKIKNTDIKIENYFYPTTIIRYGLMKNIELRLEVDVTAQRTTTNSPPSQVTLSGLNPLIIGAKYHLCQQKKLRPETAFVFGLTLPGIGKKEFLPKYPSPAMAFYCLNTINKKWNIGYNISMQWNGNDANPVSSFTIAPGYNFSERVAGYVELYTYYTGGQIPDYRLDAGISYIPVPDLQFDVYGGPGISGPATNYFISAGISLRLPK